MEETYFTGLLVDNRTDEEKAKDFHQTELVAMGTVTPKFRTVTDGQWAKYTPRNQDGSGSCVANTVAKMLEVKRKMGQGDVIKFSHAPIYIKRSNKPSTGMVGVNALQIACATSSCKESDVPSENMSDAQLDAITLPANFEDLNNLVLPSHYTQLPMDFDYIAAMVEKEGCAMIWVNTDYQNWCKDIPTAGGKKGGVVHSVAAVDAITLDGIQYLVIEDSLGKWFNQNGLVSKYGEYGQRLITREFFNDAVWFGALLLDFKFNVTDGVFEPFTTPMLYGQTSDEIARYQKLLLARGFLPVGTECTGYYGNITARATYIMQIKYNVAPLAELNSVMVNGKIIKGGAVRTKTLATINAKLLK